MRRWVLLGLCLLLAGTQAWAIDVTHMPTEQLQSRYRTLTHDFRCLVCQGEDIYTSNSELAIQLRHKVRDQLLAGKSNQAIIDYMVARYGQFILYKPPVQPNTWLLWFGPFGLLIIALWVVWRVVRRRSSVGAGAHDDDKEQHTP